MATPSTERFFIFPARCPVSVSPENSTSEDNQQPFRLGHRRWLDGLRGVATLLVLATHFRFIRGGFVGLDIFFVLSGFLITTLLVTEWQRNGSISFRHFYFRRLLRVIPAFVVLLVIFTIHTLVVSPPELMAARWHELAVVACFVANWIQIHGASLTMLGHTWSLSVEEQFYFLWPALLCLLARFQTSRRTVLTLVIVGILASFALRLGLNQLHLLTGTKKIAIERLYAGLDTRADALLAGCLAGLLVAWKMLPNSARFHALLKGATALAAAGLAFSVYSWDTNSAQLYDGMFTVIALLTAILIVSMVMAPSRIAVGILESGPLVGVGKISYGLYLFHFPMLVFVGPETVGPQSPGWTALVFLMTLGSALLSYYLIERPFLHLKGWLGSPQAKATASPPRPLSASEDQTPQRKAA